MCFKTRSVDGTEDAQDCRSEPAGHRDKGPDQPRGWGPTSSVPYPLPRPPGQGCPGGAARGLGAGPQDGPELTQPDTSPPHLLGKQPSGGLGTSSRGERSSPQPVSMPEGSARPRPRARLRATGSSRSGTDPPPRSGGAGRAPDAQPRCSPSGPQEGPQPRPREPGSWPPGGPQVSATPGPQPLGSVSCAPSQACEWGDSPAVSRPRPLPEPPPGCRQLLPPWRRGKQRLADGPGRRAGLGVNGGHGPRYQAPLSAEGGGRGGGRGPGCEGSRLGPAAKAAVAEPTRGFLEGGGVCLPADTG